MVIKLYEVIKEDNGESFSIKFSDEQHKIFKAHFPGNPIVPGYCMIDILSDVLGDEIVTIKKAKFISSILPHDVVTVLYKRMDERVKATVTRDNIKISEVIYETNLQTKKP